MTKEDIQNHFKDGSGNIPEIKLMNGFGFIEFDDALDARDVVPGKLCSINFLSLNTKSIADSPIPAFRTFSTSSNELK